jgi:hypothetical protein
MLKPASAISLSRVPIGFKEFEGDRQFATTLARGLALLRCFTPDQPVLGNKDLVMRLGLPSLRSAEWAKPHPQKNNPPSALPDVLRNDLR